VARLELVNRQIQAAKKFRAFRQALGNIDGMSDDGEI